jgi:Kelch motif
LTPGRFRAGLLFCALAALLIAPATASAVNPVSFSYVGNLTAPREYPGAARLNDGRVLVVGGYAGGIGLDSAEIFDPTTNSFTAVGATMSTGRYAPAVATLPDGRVLVAGGWKNNTVRDQTSAEVFNPSTGTFSPVGSLGVAREEAATAPLPDGRILVAGGYSSTTDETLTSSEIFDPSTNTFSPGPTLPFETYGPATAVLSGHRILIAGGYTSTTSDYLSSATVFDPSAGSFSPVASLPVRNWSPAGASLPQGRGLITGGYDDNVGDVTASALIFDPATNSFSSAGIGTLNHAREEAAAVELADGRVLVAGGWDTGPTDVAEVLSVPSNAFTAKLKGRKVKFSVTDEGVAQVTDVSTQVATTAKKKKKKKPRLVKTTSLHGGPGTIVVKIKLTKQGSAKLRQKGKLQVRVVYTPDEGISATKKLKLRAGK